MIRLAYAVAAICGGLALWQALICITDAPRFILPSPLLVATTGWENRALLMDHAGATLGAVLLGLAVGVTLGASTAIVLARFDRLQRLTMPMLVFTQAVPVFALAPVLTLWFGYGLTSKVVMAVLIIYFPVVGAFYDGLLRVPAGLLDLAQTMGASKTRTLWLIRVPYALPSLGTGVKLAAVYAPIGAVIGEWVGSSQGLGYLMLLANGRAKTDLMFASLITLAAMAIALHAAVSHAVRTLERP